MRLCCRVCAADLSLDPMSHCVLLHVCFRVTVLLLLSLSLRTQGVNNFEWHSFNSCSTTLQVDMPRNTPTPWVLANTGGLVVTAAMVGLCLGSRGLTVFRWLFERPRCVFACCLHAHSFSLSCCCMCCWSCPLFMFMCSHTNAGRFGFYRVNYSEPLWLRLAAVSHSPHAHVSSIDLAGVVRWIVVAGTVPRLPLDCVLCEAPRCCSVCRP